MAEEHFIPSNSTIECSGCKGIYSTVVSTTANVYVKKQPMAIESDGTSAHITPFCGICSFTRMTCTPVLTGKWASPRETITVQKKMPLIEQSKAYCANGGTITIVEKTDTPAPPENVVDKAQTKINKAANYTVKKTTELAQNAKVAMGDLGASVQQAASVFQNDNVRDLLNNTGALVDSFDRKKAELDTAVGNVNIRLDNLRAELKQLLTGQEQELQDLMTVKNPEQETEENKNAEEDKYHQEFFNEANSETVNEFLRAIESDIDVLGGIPPEALEKDFEITSVDDSSERYFTSSSEEATTEADATNQEETPTVEAKDKTRAERFLDNARTEKEKEVEIAEKHYNEANKILEEYKQNLGDPNQKKQVLKSIAALNGISRFLNKEQKDALKEKLLANQKAPNPSTKETIERLSSKFKEEKKEDLKALIEEKREGLDAKVQTEIDEVLNEIGYLERMQKYKQESEELQEKLDKTSAALDAMSNFNGFIDGVTAKYFGRLGEKYQKAMDQMGKNMTRLNDASRGASYVTSGFATGDVVTQAPDVKKEEPKTETPPPVLPPPTKPEPEEPEESKEEPESTDECSFTKIKVIKNDGPYAVLYGNDEKDIIQPNKHININLPKPIQFVAGTTKERSKKLTIQINELKRTNLPTGSIIVYHIDDDYKHHGIPASGDIDWDLDMIYKESLFQGHRFLANFMGLMDIDKTKYSIPLKFCGYETQVLAEVSPDATWTFLFSIGSDDPRTYKHTNQPPGKVFKKHQDKSRRIGQLNSKKINFGNRTATLKFQYGVTYDNDTKGQDLSFSSKLTKLYSASEKIFKIVGGVDKFVNLIIDNNNKLSKKAGYVSIAPPAVGVALSRSIKSSNTLYENDIGLTGEIRLDPVLAIDLQVDLIRAASNKLIFVRGIVELVEAITDRDISTVLFIEAKLQFNFKLIGKIDDDLDWSISNGIGAMLQISAGLMLEGSFLGIEYEATIKGSAAGSFDLSTSLLSEGGKMFFESSLMFNGINAAFAIVGSVKGWGVEKELSYEYKKIVGKWDNPFAGKIPITD